MKLLRWIKAMIALPGRMDLLEQNIGYLRGWRIAHLVNHAKNKPTPCLLARWCRRNRREG